MLPSSVSKNENETIVFAILQQLELDRAFIAVHVLRLFVLSVKFSFDAMFVVIVQVLHSYCQFINVANMCVLWGNLLKVLHIAPGGW